MGRFLVRFALRFVLFLTFVGLLGAGAVLGGLWYFGRGLPDYQQLANYQPPVLTRVHAGDGRVLAEFATERRLFVPIEAIPKQVIGAILAAEDKSFYSHPGISLPDIARAALTNVMNLDRRPIGASTITQQVAKNFLLTNEVSIQRKAKEAILAFRIEQALSKNRILELYLNEIYLGAGAYGVAAAALNYFNKPLDELTLAEAAFLAALPKAPNNYHPVRFPEAAKARRDWVLGRMREEGLIDDAAYEQARRMPLQVRGRGEVEMLRAEYFTEEIRRELIQRFGESRLYGGGLSVRTTLDPRLQEIADRALRRGLVVYDRRHGWRGPVARIGGGPGWDKRLQTVPKPVGLPASWSLAAVLALNDRGAEVGVADGRIGAIPFAEIQWARAAAEQQRLGPPLRVPADALAIGDVVAVEPLEQSVNADRPLFALRQMPNVSGGVVALDPHTGRVLAMSGGWSFEQSQFNRVTQAVRQPGSAFKPFVYVPALDAGMTPSSLVLDAPIVIDQGPGLARWKPSNYTRNFFGPSPLRVGIEQSRNLMTVRLAENIGMERVAEYAQRFGIVDQLPPHLSMALGAGETTLLRLTTAYAMLVNGGKRVRPTLIDRVQDRNGKTVFKHDARPCPDCAAEAWTRQAMPALPDPRPQVIGADTAYQMVSMLQGVVDRGTGRRIKDIGKPLAGKTGTTNESFDTWFVGFSPDLVVGVYVGFDTPRTLGPNETGASVAAPIFKDVMADALKDKPSIPFRIPKGIRLVRVNPATGLVARSGERDVIWESFKPGTEPTAPGPVLDGGTGLAASETATPIPASDTGGLY